MAFESTSTPLSNHSSRITYSCIRCSDRKVRCDRQNPCGTCIKRNVQCTFRSPPPSRRKERRNRDGTLKDKLERYEALFQRLGVDADVLPEGSRVERDHVDDGSKIAMTDDVLQLPTPASTTTNYERAITTSQILHGQERSKFITKYVELLLALPLC